MAKSKKNNNKNPRNKSLTIIALLVLIAFSILIFSDYFKSSSKKEVRSSKIEKDVYKFNKQGELTFQSSDGKYINTIDIELADNHIKRVTGLMHRTKMEENQGMLFVFVNEEIQSFHMKNTVLSLDMIFINSNLEIVTILKNTKPYDLNSYPSTAPAQYVLETIGGYTDKYNVSVGDKVVFRKTN